jgi:hypothetical protein
LTQLPVQAPNAESVDPGRAVSSVFRFPFFRVDYFWAPAVMTICMRALTPVLLAAAAVLFHSQAHAGYTHYFTWRKLPSDAELRPCVDEMRLIVEARKSILVAPDEPGAVPGSPKIMASSVDFNGIGDDAHEPFVFPGQTGFNFCKTAAKPYDEIVTACLIVARDHFPASVLSISSDGSWEDWAAGAKLYRSVLRRPARNPMAESWTALGSRGIGIVLLGVALLGLSIIYWLKRKLGNA